MKIIAIFGFLVLAVPFSQGGISSPYSFYFRHNWHAMAAKKQTPMTGKADVVVIKEMGVGGLCFRRTKDIQRADIEHFKHDDIDCSFVIDVHKYVCEGRGWKNSVIGNKALVLCVLCISRNDHLSKNVIPTITSLLDSDKGKKNLDPNYKIITLRDMYPDSWNPQSGLYKAVKKLPRYQKASTQSAYKSLLKMNEKSFIIG